MAYLQKRTAINSLFGVYEIEQDKTNVKFTDINDTEQNIYDNILRGKDGIQKKIMMSEHLATAISSPADFLTKKRNSLAEIVKTLNDEFKKIFKRQLSRNLPLKQTRENTRKEIDILYEKLMKYHNEDFPRDLVERAIIKSVGK